MASKNALIAFLAVRHFRRMPPVTIIQIVENIVPLADLHGIEFQKDRFTLTENNPLVYLESIPDAPRSQIRYRDIINIDHEDNYLFILLRTGYDYRLSKWGTERIYNHLYWDRTRRGENPFVRWWYRL